MCIRDSASFFPTKTLASAASPENTTMDVVGSGSMAARYHEQDTASRIQRAGYNGQDTKRRILRVGFGLTRTSDPTFNQSGMDDYKKTFIDFMMQIGVLTFGDFTTKSGRKTPYFVNTGLYRTGSQLNQLGEFYADTILSTVGDDFDVLFGPAYKGIPLVVATASALSRRGRDVAFCFNRKEAKDHGEGGVLVGHKLQDGDRVLIIEDVTTAGTSIRETVPVLRAAADVSLAGLVVSVDRAERGKGEQSALAEVGEEFSMPTFSIVNVHEIMQHVDLADDDLQRMKDYLGQYGA